MHPMPELIPMLKQLRLSGILDSIEVRNRQAIEEKLPYTEFLALLIQDEVARRTQKKLVLRLRRGGLNSNKTFESFDFTFNPSTNKTQLLDLATCRFMEEKVCVLLVGPCGTGKSHIVQALGHAARAINTYHRRFTALAKVDLLVIDDFGLKPLRPPQDEDFHDLIAERYKQRSTIVTSNLDFAEWGSAFPNRLLGAATIDRLRHGAYRIVLDGESRRSPKPFPKSPKMRVAKGGEMH